MGEVFIVLGKVFFITEEEYLSEEKLAEIFTMKSITFIDVSCIV